MMERIWLVVLYLSGWNISTCLLLQYHYVADQKTWTEAQTYCRATYTDLATIANYSDMEQLVSTVSSSGYNSEVWIGAYTRIDWRWSDGYKGSGAEYRNWETTSDDEPDFYSYRQYCVNIGRTRGWWDDNCMLSYPFICNNGTQLDPEFVLVSEKMNWRSAQRYCRENFRDLATVRNYAENEEIWSLVPSGDWAWIGLFRDPHMYWSNGSSFTVSYWALGGNVIGSMSVMCGLADMASGKWKIRPCQTTLPFVCYGVPPPPPVMRQIVKLRIKPEDASVDLNDDAVKADILRKLQASLKEKGVSGVTLKWREQPDGKVFHKEGKPSKKKLVKKAEL